MVSDGENISKMGGGAKPMTRFSSLTTKGGSGVARNFKREGHNFHNFCQAYFFGRTNLKLIKKQEKLQEGPGACSPGNFSKIYML